jgi:hypothetical protein
VVALKAIATIVKQNTNSYTKSEEKSIRTEKKEKILILLSW